ncbi:amino acid ABC transporter substrate-binding protein [Clostridium sp. BJN0001]|uniref:amino acid ABC transporter substrate-binding protein n=1 Tax=Clostridium sp. BJN0001 TaxID=2930219 RepID=UPI001FD02798|nr:amino acid ABC transporter substrate-binding protein [Clostridium sp. BJN0001]
MNYKKNMKKICSFLVVMLLGVCLTGCKSNSSSATESALDKDELIIGIDDTFVPMGFKDDSGNLTGFDVELAKEVGEKMGKTIKFQSINWSMKETELNNGNIDLIWNGYSISDERKEKVDFSSPYLNNRQVIITLSDSSIKSKQDLKGKKVGAQNQSTAVDAIESDSEEIEKEFDSGKVITFETNNDAFMDLEAGRLDAVVADEILAKYYINERGNDKYNVLSDDFGKEQYAVGMRKNDDKFKDAFNKALKEVIEDNDAKEISEKWFGDNIIISE